MFDIGIIGGKVIDGKVCTGQQASGTSPFYTDAVADYFEAGMFVDLRARFTATIAGVVNGSEVTFIGRNTNFFFNLVPFYFFRVKYDIGIGVNLAAGAASGIRCHALTTGRSQHPVASAGWAKAAGRQDDLPVGYSGVGHYGTVIAAVAGGRQRVIIGGIHVGAAAVYCAIAVGEKWIIHKRYLLICDFSGAGAPVRWA